MAFSLHAQNNLLDQNSRGHNQRIEQLHEARMKLLMQSLNLSDTQKTPFKDLYEQYSDSRSKVFRGFAEKYHGQNLTEEQAKARIYDGFDVSEKLLNVQRDYTEKFLKIISPKQLNKMFRMEKVMSSKLMERHLQEEEKQGQ